MRDTRKWFFKFTNWNFIGTILRKEKDHDFALVQFQDPFRLVQIFSKYSPQPNISKSQKESFAQIKAKMITFLNLQSMPGDSKRSYVLKQTCSF